MGFFDEFKKAPGEHIADLCEDKLNGKDKSLGKLYSSTLENLYEIKDSINGSFIKSKLDEFVRAQNLKVGLVSAARAAQEDRLDDAENIIRKTLDKKILLFDPGFVLSDPKGVSKVLKTSQNDLVKLKINEFDRREICPARGELFLIMGLVNTGKSFFLNHVGVSALTQKKRVLHITLEMSWKKVMRRYFQNIFGISKHEEPQVIPIFEKDDEGNCHAITFRETVPKLTFSTPRISSIISEKLEKIKKSNKKLIVKQFPTRQLTIPQLRAFIDNLIEYYNFIPDVILIDYPDLMKIDVNNKRVHTGVVLEEIRGLGVEYNAAIVAPTQSNREGYKTRWLSGQNTAEDHSKYATADIVVTMNQTDEENERKILRLFAPKVRDDTKGCKLIISQNYSKGKFHLDSFAIRKSTEDIYNMFK